MSIRSPRAMARAAIAVTTTAALGLTMSTVANGQSTSPDDNVAFAELRGPDTVAPSLDWIERELAANGGSLPSQFDPSGQTPDWGLTADAVLALNSGGRGAEESATTATGLMAASINDYITGQTFGDPNGVFAGPVGKSFVTAIVQQQDPNDFGGVDLEALSRAAIEQTGLQAGRFSDRNSIFGNNSNGFGQAYNILGLSTTPDGVPENAAAFLLDQQCPNGGFRLNYDTMPVTRGCDDNAEVDVDGSGLALQALLVLGDGPEVIEAIEKVSAWLASIQRGNGSFPNSASTENSNTTGVVAQALAAVGDPSAADNAAMWISTITVTEAETADGTPSPVDIGAIAFTKGAFDTALVSGLPTDVAGRDQWRRATTQAVLASLPVFLPEAFVGGAFGRFLDTRPDGSTVDGEDVGGGPVAAGAVVEFQVAGRGGVPDDAEAIAGNVTITDVGQRGFATVWDCSEPRPGSSSVNYAGPGAAYPNAVITELSDEGTVCVFVQRQAQVIFDVTGFFPFGSGYEPAAGRFGDTRPDGSTVDGEDVGGGPVAAGAVV
ncbi:MAG: prenyltransferase/squalene oxidase repeat-containing protein, partial [Actinomycetota bacterium]